MLCFTPSCIIRNNLKGNSTSRLDTGDILALQDQGSYHVCVICISVIYLTYVYNVCVNTYSKRQPPWKGNDCLLSIVLHKRLFFIERHTLTIDGNGRYHIILRSIAHIPCVVTSNDVMYYYYKPSLFV
jgi:hypothetical protein